MRNLRYLLLMGLLATNAHAGWVSIGGGELFKDAHNPFFLKNVSEVRYCVQVATTSVSATPETVRGLVKEAIAYWKNEMTKVANSAGAGQFVLGQQTFTEVDCTADGIALKIQVGYETLDGDQLKFLVRPTDFIGVSVRTDYDTDLRGKGFIFIASDIGANSYHSGSDTTLIPRAWEHPKLLKYALMHELGHVMGLPHTGSGLMSEVFLEQILSTGLADAFERTPIESFFAPDDELDLCDAGMLSNRTMSWLGAPADHTCVHLSHKTQNSWEIRSRKNESSQQGSLLLGQLLAGAPDLMDYRPRPAIVLQLMGNTTLFSPEETLFRSFMFGPMFVDMGMKGNFVPASGGAVKPAYIRLTPEALQVQAVIDGKIEMLMSYFSPLGFLILKDPTP